MLTASEVKESLTEDNILTLLVDLGAEPDESDNKIECLTVCHGGDSHKLIYYKDTHMFMCYTSCGSMDIFSLVAKIKEINFAQALQFIAKRFNISGIRAGFHSIEDLDVVEIPNYQPKKVEMTPLTKLDEGLMNGFYSYYFKGWIDEGISMHTMDKFEIKYQLLDNQIVIPHRNTNGDLVGIRVRNLNQEQLDLGRKYIPIFMNGKSMRYLTGMNLYGFYQNREVINKDKKIIIFEGEKSVLKMEDYFPNNNYSVAISGSNMTAYQEKIIDDLTDVNEIIVAIDKEFTDANSMEAQIYAEKIMKIYGKLANRYNVSVMWDSTNLLDYKDSPVDKGKEVFEQLYKERLYI